VAADNVATGFMFPLGIDDSVQIERRRRDRGLAQHHVNLSAMVRLVIEEVAHGDGSLLGVLDATAVRVAQ
jgi:hypothetical protein